MTVSLKKRRLSASEITKLSSSYLTEGKKQDIWEITSVEVADKMLTAKVRMRSHYASASDKGGFHLTLLSTLEILSQVKIIFVHVLAGYSEKTREGWMLESNVVCKRAIRDPKHIVVRMKLLSMKNVKNSILIVTKSEVTDKHGLFEARLKGLLS